MMNLIETVIEFEEKYIPLERDNSSILRQLSHVRHIMTIESYLMTTQYE